MKLTQTFLPNSAGPPFPPSFKGDRHSDSRATPPPPRTDAPAPVSLAGRYAHAVVCSERKAGEMLVGMELKAGRPPEGNRSKLLPLEINGKQSQRWQQACLKYNILARGREAENVSCGNTFRHCRIFAGC